MATIMCDGEPTTMIMCAGRPTAMCPFVAVPQADDHVYKMAETPGHVHLFSGRSNGDGHVGLETHGHFLYTGRPYGHAHLFTERPQATPTCLLRDPRPRPPVY